MTKAAKARVKDFRPATVNANRHSARGLGALTASVQSDGWIGAMTTANDGEMIAGSARIETAAQVFGVDAEPIVIESDGTRPIIVRRTDIPQADDPRAVRLALADNRVAELDLTWDVEVLAGLDADVLEGLWTADELSDLGQQWAEEIPEITNGVIANTTKDGQYDKTKMPVNIGAFLVFLSRDEQANLNPNLDMFYRDGITDIDDVREIVLRHIGEMADEISDTVSAE